jgi:hypothetical protein
LMLLLPDPWMRIGSLANPSSSMIVLNVLFKLSSSFRGGSRFSFQKELANRQLERRLVVLFSW